MGQKLVGKRESKDRQACFAILKAQLLICLVIAIGVLPFDRTASVSTLLGGMIYLVPTYWQAKRHFDRVPDSSAQKVIMEVFAGQIWKMALMATLFALVFAFFDKLSVFSIFASLILLQFVNFVARIRGETFFK